MIRNDSNVFTARMGFYGGKLYTFTHRNPQTGELYAEDYQVSVMDSKNNRTRVWGKWLPADKVELR